MTMTRWLCVGITAMLVSCVTAQEESGSSTPTPQVESVESVAPQAKGTTQCRLAGVKCTQDKQCCQGTFGTTCLAGICHPNPAPVCQPAPAGTFCASSADCCGEPCTFNVSLNQFICNGPSSCVDGVQDNGETGVDCGGPCFACP
jgi:hypothetical protein